MIPRNPGIAKKMIPKNPGIAQKGTQKSESNPKKVPKIMAHPHIVTYASYPPPRVPDPLERLKEFFSPQRGSTKF